MDFEKRKKKKKKGKSETEETHLLNTRNVLGHILNTDRVFDSQTVRLTFHSRFVYQDSTIGGET